MLSWTVNMSAGGRGLGLLSTVPAQVRMAACQESTMPKQASRKRMARQPLYLLAGSPKRPPLPSCIASMDLSAAKCSRRACSSRVCCNRRNSQKRARRGRITGSTRIRRSSCEMSWGEVFGKAEGQKRLEGTEETVWYLCCGIIKDHTAATVNHGGARGNIYSGTTGVRRLSRW